MKIRWIIVFGLILSAIGLLGAKEYLPINQSWLFTEKYPDKTERYVLAPVSLHYLEVSDEWNSEIINSILDGVEDRMDEAEELRRYIQSLRETDFGGVMALLGNDFSDRLKGEDQVFYFEYKEEHYEDTGILVIRRGDIVYRKPFDWIRRIDESDANERPIRIDEL